MLKICIWPDLGSQVKWYRKILTRFKFGSLVKIHYFAKFSSSPNIYLFLYSIQFIIILSEEHIELLACNTLQIYSHSWFFNRSTFQWMISWTAYLFRYLFKLLLVKYPVLYRNWLTHLMKAERDTQVFWENFIHNYQCRGSLPHIEYIWLIL